MKIYRVLGKEGRITVPFMIRQLIGFKPNDVVSFEVTDTNTVIVRREALEGKAAPLPDTKMPCLKEFLDNLTAKEQFAAIVYLSDLWAERQEAKKNG